MAETKKPATVTSEQVKRYRQHLKKVREAAWLYSLDMDQVGKDIDRAASRLPKPPDQITGESDLQNAQDWLRRVQVIRTRLGKMQQSCQRAKTVWSELLDVAKRFLWSQPPLQALKNDTQRMRVVDRVTGKLTLHLALVSGCLKEIDGLLWVIKDNQAAVIGMINAWKEETWAHKQGVD